MISMPVHVNIYVVKIYPISLYSKPETILCGTISYPLFADANTGIYPHAASQYTYCDT